MFKWKFLTIMALFLLLAACSPQPAPSEAAPAAQVEPSAAQQEAATDQPESPTAEGEAPAQGVSYASEIQPIFNASCSSCHGGSGGLTLSSYDQLMAGGRSGAPVIAASPGESLLLKRLTGEVTPKMPPGSSLSDEQIALIRQWIEEGALNN